MHLSRFNQYIENYPAAGSTLIYNALTGAFLEIDNESRAGLERLDRGEVTTDEVTIDPAWLDEDAQILVNSHEDDERAFREWYDSMRSRTDVMRALVSVTLSCNLDCTYCCQADVLDGTTITPANAEATATFLAGRAIEVGAGVLEVTFIGGEPLLQKGRIEKMVQSMRSMLDAHGIELQFGLITNGVYLTRELVERWVPLGLRGAKVTLDGDETTHSHTRRSKKNAPDSYSTIFQNVVECSELIHIKVSGNYQEDTIHGFPALITKLRAAGLKSSSEIDFGPVLDQLGAPEGVPGTCTHGGSRPEWMIALRDMVARAGFDPGSDPTSFGPCGFHLNHYFTIDPQGHIYKCPGFLGKSKWAIGHVTTGLTSAYERMVEARPHEKHCGTCSHRPDCTGGCVAAKWLREEKEDGINCEHEYFERVGDALIKRKYAFAVAAVDGSDPFDLIPALELPSPKPPRSVQGPERRSPALRVLAA